jgi:hypothetical protein
MDALAEHLRNGAISVFGSTVGFGVICTRHMEFHPDQLMQTFPKYAGK